MYTKIYAVLWRIMLVQILLPLYVIFVFEICQFLAYVTFWVPKSGLSDYK